MKEKDGTLEVVLRDCAMEGKDGESGEKLRRVLCYLDVNKTGEAAEAVSKQKPSPAVGEKIRVFGEGKAADPARNPGALITVCIAGPRNFRVIYVEGYTVTGGKVHVFSDSLYRIRRCFSERLKAIALPEDAGILSAVLFGEKNDLDSEIYELYRKNGDIPPPCHQRASCLHCGAGNLEDFQERRGGVLDLRDLRRGISLRLRHDGGQRRVCGPGGVNGRALLSRGGRRADHTIFRRRCVFRRQDCCLPIHICCPRRPFSCPFLR